MGLIRRAGRILRLVSGVLARACCCDIGCCYVNGTYAPQYTTREDCEQCDRVFECEELVAKDPLLPCPDGDGWLDYGDACYRIRNVSDCADCGSYAPPYVGESTCTHVSEAGVCGQWLVPCPDECIYVRYEHPTWTIQGTPFTSSSCGNSGLEGEGCDTEVGQQYIAKPLSMAGKAVSVSVAGSFDDNISINGTVVGGLCRHAGPVLTSLTLDAGTAGFTLGAIDSYGVCCHGYLSICFSEVNPLP